MQCESSNPCFTTRKAHVTVAESGVTIEEREGLDMVQVSAWAQTAESACALIAEAFGVQPPMQPNSVATDGTTRILWLGPHRWLIVTPRQKTPDLAAELSAILPTATAAVVDLGAGRSVFAVSGARVRDLLAKELPIDLHPAKFPPGRCVQSSMAHVGVLVHATAKDSFELFVYRAFAQHFREVLDDAALEYAAADAR